MIGVLATYRSLVGKLSLVIILFFTLINKGFTNDTLFIDAEFEKTKVSKGVLVLSTPHEISINEALTYFSESEDLVAAPSTTFGFTTELYWLYFTVKNTSSRVLDEVLVISNPHIDFLNIWDAKSQKKIYGGGDHIPFDNRTYINRNVAVPVQFRPNESRSFLILADKRSASLSVPIALKERASFDQEEESIYFVYGIYFGILMLIIVFSLFVFSILKQEIFFWYAFYIFFLGMYLLAHIGLMFQMVYPNLPEVNDYARPFFITFSTSALIHFIRLLLNIRKFLPGLNKYFTYLIIILNVSMLWWVSTPWWHDTQTIIYLNIQNITLLVSLVLVLISSILTFNKQRVIVGFFWVAFMAVLFAGLSIILIESGVISEDKVSFNPLFLGSLIEIVVFAMGLSYWSKVNDNDRLRLVKLISNSKKQMVDSYLTGIETEKALISSDLHDDIGSRLSHLKRKTEARGAINNDVIKHFERITKKVRDLSHGLAPLAFSSNEFLISIRHLVFSHQSDDTAINLQIFDLPKELNQNVSKHLYRIVQSALSNIEKHANATNVDIQFFYHRNELVLAIEDNGVGFQYSKNHSGIGIKNMKSRVESTNGTIEISSTKKHGTSIMVTIPD
jgi:signal transduction histidine kinase